MGTWDIKSLKELDKFMDENEIFYDRKGKTYKPQEVSIVVNNFETYGERNKTVKKHHHRFQAFVIGGSVVDLFTKDEYEDMLKKQENDKKEVKSIEKLWEFE